MCERDFYIKRGALDLTNDVSLNSIKDVIKKIKNKVEFINISAGYGEPLLHKNIIQIIREFKNNNLKVILFTNATLLTKPLSKKLITSGLDLILFSFEGYSPTEYENLRIGANYKKVFENIQNFIKLKGKKKLPKTILTATISKEKYFQKISSLINLAKTLSVDKLEIHDTFFCKSSNKQQLQRRIINVKNKKRLLKDFRILRKKAINCGLKITLPEVEIQNGIILCPDPWRSLYFRKDGYVRPCCIDYEKVWNKNIFYDSLEEIWNSAEMIAWRKKFIEGKPPKMCRKCPIGVVPKNKKFKRVLDLI
jgi:radical SAM protein with 4Fe4S-binding SPASM domain